MGNKINYRVGTKIIEAGRVYRIFKINKKKFNGKTEKCIHYRPFFKNSPQRQITCSMPETSFLSSNIRKPASKKTISELLTYLSKKAGGLTPLDAVKAKADLVSKNDFKVNIKILRKCWAEKKRKENGLTRRKQEVFNIVLEGLTEEIALAYRISLQTAENKIMEKLH